MSLHIENREQLRIQAELVGLFTQRLNVEVPSETTDLFETGILDSQKFIELLLQIEEQFKAHIAPEDFEIENFRCIQKIASLILCRKAAECERS